jgi:hypothetical protein
MKNKFILVLFTCVWFLIACQPATKLTVQSISSDFKPSTSGFFYSLPRTVVEVTLELKHDIYIPGPFSQYAAQFLGIEGISLERKEEWTISSETFSSYMESDPEHVFYAGFSAGNPRIPELLTLTKNGLIFSPGSSFASNLRMLGETSSLNDTVWFTDLSMEYFYYQKTDTLYKTVLRDSSFVKIPVYKIEELQKSDEQKAKEAASTIIKLRKRRFKLLSGAYNFITEGAALEVTVRELTKMEQEYLSLFTGKHFTEFRSYNNYVIPALKSEAVVLFRFSKDQGILPVEGKTGSSITVTFARENLTTSADINTTPADNSLYFRIPANATLQLSMNNKSLGEKRIAIYQFGKIQIMPVIPRGPNHRWHL